MDQFLVRSPTNGGGKDGESSSSIATPSMCTLSPIKHVKKRREVYFGCPCIPEGGEFWDFVDGRMVVKSGMKNPGVEKLFDELFANGGDYSSKGSKLFVEFDAETGKFAIQNDTGIHVHLMEDGKTWSVDAAFSKLNTGTNFDDNVKRTTGGLNGVGAKLCVIFASSFEVTTKCPHTKVVYRQRWNNQLSESGPPQVYMNSLKKLPKAQRTLVKTFEKLPTDTFKGTRIEFMPKYSEFGGQGTYPALRESLNAYVRRRCFEIAATRKLKVFLNGEKMVCPDMKSMAKLYAGSGVKPVVISGHSLSSTGAGGAGGNATSSKSAAVQLRWEAAIVPKIESLRHSMSYVNSIHTQEGGTHVNEYSKIFAKVASSMSSKTEKITGAFVRANCDLFLSSIIENPRFSNQSKQKLVSPRATWGSTPVFEKKTTASVVRALREQITAAHLAKQQEALGKSTRSRSRQFGPKTDDANLAGGRHSSKCQMWFCEGDSAKSLVVEGLKALGKKGRDLHGVFPMKGKLLNTRGAAPSKIQNNAEIMNMIRVLGLKLNSKLESHQEPKSLRYGSICIITDQDPDGSHIKGLIMNALARFYPRGLRTPGFLKIFHTPIVKAKCRGRSHDFYSLAEFESWREGLDTSPKTKYYKGLGSWTSADAREMFLNMQRHTVAMEPATDADLAALDAAFGDDVGRRRELMRDYEPVGDPRAVRTIRSFVSGELSECFLYDTTRSIVGIDGFKPSQRKVVQTGLDNRSLPMPGADTRGPKVAQFGGKTSEKMGYHHGEKSLEGVIVSLCQDFTGSNNLPILYGDGQFGTADQGGKDAAAARYIYVTLQKYTRSLLLGKGEHFRHVLDYNTDDGQQIEAKEFFPVVPLVLINGAEGIGTGYSCSIPPHRLGDMADRLLARLEGRAVVSEDFPAPAYRGFDAPASRTKDTEWMFRGSVSNNDGNNAQPSSVDVMDLAPGVWTDSFVNSCRKRGFEATKHVSAEGKSYLKVSVDPDAADRQPSSSKRRKKNDSLRDTVVDMNKSRATLGNMWIFVRDAVGVPRLRKFETTSEIFDAYYETGEKYYTKSLEFARAAALRLAQSLRKRRDYIQLFVSDKVSYPIVPETIEQLMVDAGWEEEHGAAGCGSSASSGTPSVRDLMHNVSDFQKTQAQIDALDVKIQEAQRETKRLEESTWKTMWTSDLVSFLDCVPDTFK